MKRTITRCLLALGFLALIAASLPSCKTYCPGVDGTGNSATRGANRGIFIGKSHCPAVSGTGNYKPKVKNKKEDGLMSAKMERQMERANSKKAGPLESKKLEFK